MGVPDAVLLDTHVRIHDLAIHKPPGVPPTDRCDRPLLGRATGLAGGAVEVMLGTALQA
ncbi:hypothetical protein [Embleya sp. NPDC059237]|uniref:hypothetical protein n=1 Tax=Embleya sp. NPDC059237 TaxID=3346784 RepID=UPI0036BA3E9A